MKYNDEQIALIKRVAGFVLIYIGAMLVLYGLSTMVK